MTGERSGPGPHDPGPRHRNTDSTWSYTPRLSVPRVQWDERTRNFWGESDSEAGCGKTPILNGLKTTGKLGVFSPPCGTWGCENCGGERAKELLKHLSHIWAGYDNLWYASARYSPQARTRISKRRQGARSQWLAIRNRGNLHYISTVALHGRQPPNEWEAGRPEDVLQVVASRFLLLPWVERVRLSSGWRLPPEPNTGPSNWKGFGSLRQEVRERAVESAYETMRLRYPKAAIKPWAELPEEIPVSEFFDVLQAAVIAARMNWQPGTDQ